MSEREADVLAGAPAWCRELDSNPLVAPGVGCGWNASDDSKKDAIQTEGWQGHISTAEEYWEVCEKLDQLRCHVGQRLPPSACKLYGPTWPCSRRLHILFHWPKKTRKGGQKALTGYEREEYRIILGPRWVVLIVDMVALTVFPALSTYSYMGLTHWAFHMVSWVLCVINIMLVLWCAMTDPGIVPRRQHKGIVARKSVSVLVPVPNFKALETKLQPTEMEEKTDAAENKLVLNGFFDDERLTFIDDTSADVLPAIRAHGAEKGMIEMDLRLCPVCRIYRAPRTYHCRTCDCCVDQFDHHCVWTGCCIGKNNYHIFFYSLAFLHINMMYIFVFNVCMNVAYIAEHPQHTVAEALGSVHFAPLIIYLLIFLFGIFMTALLAFHVFLQMRGITTLELLQRRYEKPPLLGVNPWSLGSAWRNIKYRMQTRLMTQLHSEVYSGIMVASLVEDRKTSLFLTLPEEERQRALTERVDAKGAKIGDVQADSDTSTDR